MKAVAIGQYVKGNSFIHKLDPRIKLISLIILLASIFISNSLLFISSLLGFFFLIVVANRLPLFRIIKALKPILFIITFNFILQLIYTKEGSILFEHSFSITTENYIYLIFTIVAFIIFIIITNKIFINLLLFTFIMFYVMYAFPSGEVIRNINIVFYENAVLQGSFIAVRIITIIFISTILTLCTKPQALNYALEFIMSPLKLIKFPVSEVSMMISIALRFIPTLLDESNKIMEAQASRGVDITEGSFIKKSQQIISLLIPMFIISIKRAEDLAFAMDARGFVPGNKRTSIRLYSFKIKDFIAFVFVSSLLLVSIYVGVVK